LPTDDEAFAPGTKAARACRADEAATALDPGLALLATPDGAAADPVAPSRGLATQRHAGEHQGDPTSTPSPPRR
jgi:hypothetical protein